MPEYTQRPRPPSATTPIWDNNICPYRGPPICCLSFTGGASLNEDATCVNVANTPSAEVGLPPWRQCSIKECHTAGSFHARHTMMMRWCPNNADTHARVWETSGWRLPSPSAVISHWDVQERHTTLTTRCFQTVILPGQIVVFSLYTFVHRFMSKKIKIFWVIHFKSSTWRKGRFSCLRGLLPAMPKRRPHPEEKAIFWGHFPYFSPHHWGMIWMSQGS